MLTIQCCERHAAGMRTLFPAMEAAGQKSASSNAESTPKFESILTRDVQSIFQIVRNLCGIWRFVRIGTSKLLALWMRWLFVMRKPIISESVAASTRIFSATNAAVSSSGLIKKTASHRYVQIRRLRSRSERGKTRGAITSKASGGRRLRYTSYPLVNLSA